MFEKKIVEAIISTQEEAQGKYARELHDGLGPLLSTLKMHIEWIADPGNTQNKDKIIDHSIHTIDNAIRSVKEIANNMSPHILQRFGLINAINSHIDYIKETSKIEFVVSSNLKERISSNIEIILYRIILECMNNAIKHSRAQNIDVVLKYEPGLFTLTLADDGIGFSTAAVQQPQPGMGLKSMQNRAAMIGGKLSITSLPGKGTAVSVYLENLSK